MTVQWTGRTLGQLSLGIMLIATAAPAVNAANTLDNLLREAQDPSPPSSVQQQALEARFAAAAQGQRQMLADMDTEIAMATQRREALTAQLSRNEAELTELSTVMQADMGDLAPLFATVRQVARDTAGVTSQSLLAAQYGPRDSLSQSLEQAGYVPSIDDLRRLRLLLLEEMTESGNVARFQSTIVNSQGIEESAEVVRVGAFTLAAGDRFLKFDADTGALQELATQPRQRHRALAASLAVADGGVVDMAVDPTHGAMLGLLSRTPGIAERVRQGGAIGYVIIALGAIGFLLAFARLGIVLVAGARISRQLGTSGADTGNPLGRVLRVYELNPHAATQVLELQLDEAILRETPRLEKWQGAIKVIAAVAPLLGLLGTVTGMIETFQSITLFGTGDPRMMAGGISQALMTTVLGLVVAIPLVLLHSAISGRSRALVEILEEQSAGIIARQAEKAQ